MLNNRTKDDRVSTLSVQNTFCPINMNRWNLCIKRRSKLKLRDKNTVMTVGVVCEQVSHLRQLTFCSSISNLNMITYAKTNIC